MTSGDNAWPYSICRSMGVGRSWRGRSFGVGLSGGLICCRKRVATVRVPASAAEHGRTGRRLAEVQATATSSVVAAVPGVWEAVAAACAERRHARRSMFLPPVGRLGFPVSFAGRRLCAAKPRRGAPLPASAAARSVEPHSARLSSSPAPRRCERVAISANIGPFTSAPRGVVGWVGRINTTSGSTTS